jgi:WD40 repeat protein
MDTVQRVLSLLLPFVGPEGTVQCFQVCKSWRGELEAGGFCNTTAQLCSALAGGGDAARLGQNALWRLNASSGVDAERDMHLMAFLAKSLGWKGSLQEWLQVASQEPDANSLSRGAASTAKSLGLALVKWVGKPQGRFPGSYALIGHSGMVLSVSLSRDGKRAASASDEGRVKIWNAETGAEVSILECIEDGEVVLILVSGNSTHILHTKKSRP